MTKDEALKLALEALKKSHICPLLPDDCSEAITAIKEALAHPEHGWTSERIAGIARLKEAQDKKLAQPEQEAYWERVARIKEEMLKVAYEENRLLKDHPPQRKPLTDEEINEFFQGMEPNNGFWLSFARAIEAKLKEKNNG